MRLWWWVLLGCLTAWVALAVGVGLILGRALWRHPPGGTARSREPPQRERPEYYEPGV